MPWQEVTVMQQKEELVLLARQPGANRSELARRFGVSSKTLHKWLKRYAQGGSEGLREQSRAPKRIHRISEQTAALILSVRDAHPAWGARKILARLEHLGHTSLPCESTANRLLKRHQRLHPETSHKHKAWQRFEHDAPNLIWQMDFKGHFAMLNDLRCHPLTLLDDHSRYSLCLQACENEQGKTVRAILTRIFRQYGLPRQMLMDNGSPWGHSQEHPHTELTVWLLRLGISVSHGRPHHPQTQGKEERFHRTLNAELLRNRVFRDAQDCQQAFDRWRGIYNTQRPHQALGMACPASRYRPSPVAFPEVLPIIDYASEDIVRKVRKDGQVSYNGKRFKACSQAFCGYPVALRPVQTTDGFLDVYFRDQQVGRINLNQELT